MTQERLPYSLADLPEGSLPEDPFERAALRQRRAVLNRRDIGRFDMAPETAASIAAGLVPGAGWIDYSGGFPDFHGGYEPGFGENVTRGNIGTAALQLVGAGGDLLYINPAVGATFGSILKTPRILQRAARASQHRSVQIGEWAKYAEDYPEIGPPRLYDKATSKEITPGSLAEAQALLDQGKAYWGRGLTPETEDFARDRRLIQRDMDRNGYEPYFDPAKRSDVDFTNYPTNFNMSVDAMPTRPETKKKFRDIYQTEDAFKRIVAGFLEGKKLPDVHDWFFVKQLEDEYIRVLGPLVGRRMFKKEFADMMAATTAGNRPTANFLMAHYATVMNKRGLRMPDHAYDMPYPISGRYAGQNAAQAQKQFDGVEDGFGPQNPKRHDLSASIAGHKDAPAVDSVLSGAIVPGMRVPQHYGPAQELLKIVADRLNVDARHLQDLARAGLQKMKHDAKRRASSAYRFKPDRPLIEIINESIERTHRLTGMARDEIMRRGLVLKEIPMYGIGGAAVAPAAAYGLRDSMSDNNWSTREGSS